MLCQEFGPFLTLSENPINKHINLPHIVQNSLPKTFRDQCLCPVSEPPRDGTVKASGAGSTVRAGSNRYKEKEKNV